MTSEYLSTSFSKKADKELAETDHALANRYGVFNPSRQPVHTCYVPADKFNSRIQQQWGALALESIAEHASTAQTFAEAIGEDVRVVSPWWDRLNAKLENEPIEDLRIDFEDGYGRRSDAEEDEVISQALEALRGVNTAFLGIRIKSFEAITRDRALRTLDLFLSGLIAHNRNLDNFVVTLPKVTFASQVLVMVDACVELERAHKLPKGSVKFEVQIETTQAIIGLDGRFSAPDFITAAQGRLTAFHYGTYDYSAAAGISAAFQTLDHPAADYAKQALQVSVAGTGVRLSDGSTNIIPVGSHENVRNAWSNHYRLVQRSLERGFYQGWDLSGAQLPTRFAANFTFFRNGLGVVAQRLKAYVEKVDSGVMDEPATAQALAGYFLRGLDADALDEDEVQKATGHDRAALLALLTRRGQI